MENSFDPMTGKRIKKKNRVLAVLIGIAAVLVMLIVVFVGVFEYSEWGKKRILFKSINNTFQTGAFVNTLNIMDIIGDGVYTVTVEGSGEEIDFEGSLLVNLLEKQEYLEFEMSDEINDVGTEVWLTEEELEIFVPEMYDKKFIYDYKEEHEGYIVTISELYGIDLESIDNLLDAMMREVREPSESDEQERIINNSEEIARVISELEIEKITGKKCEIEGEDHRCKGYKITIDKEMAMDYLDVYENILADDYSEASNAGVLLGAEGESLSAQFDSLRETYQNMDDIEVEFYVYRNQIAEIEMQLENGEVNFKVFGGNVPLDNYYLEIEPENGDEVTLEKEGNTEDGVEEAEYSIDGEKMIEIEYDDHSHCFELEICGDDTDTFVFEGEINRYEDEMEIFIDEVSLNREDVDIDFEICFLDECDMKVKPIEVDTFDIGRAAEDEWEMLLYDLFLQTQGTSW